MVGTTGTADSDLGLEGWVRVMGERWRAVAEEPIGQGNKVVVVGMDGLTLRVRKGA